MTFELAVQNRCTPEEAARIPIVDAASLIELISRRREQELKFEAALHDKKLR